MSNILAHLMTGIDKDTQIWYTHYRGKEYESL